MCPFLQDNAGAIKWQIQQRYRVYDRLGASVDKFDTSIDRIDDKLSGFDVRLARVEESTKSAHHRIDGLEKDIKAGR